VNAWNRIVVSKILLLAAWAAALLAAPDLASAQASPFMTGMTSLQTNIVAWLTPIAIILVMVMGAMAMANRIVENCGNTLVLRCSGSDHGGTASFASRLIGERELVRRQTSRGRDRDGLWGGRHMRRSVNVSDQHVTEAAVLPSEIEQLADLHGFLKTASSPLWMRVVV
jgi:hypothetical protein